jgi:CheY-like chemotaxis protein
VQQLGDGLDIYDLVHTRAKSRPGFFEPVTPATIMLMASVLLIEDYPSLQKVYTTVLESAGHTVYVAPDGKQGLVLANQHQIDLILLDLLMPHTGGVEFLEAYNLKNHPTVKLIILSNVYTNQLLNQVLELGASNYLIKADVTPQILVKVVDDTLAKPAPNAK